MISVTGASKVKALKASGEVVEKMILLSIDDVVTCLDGVSGLQVRNTVGNE